MVAGQMQGGGNCGNINDDNNKRVTAASDKQLT
jgi:hypothetical protein